MTVCWLRVRGGALIAQVESWSTDACSFERNGPGECWVKIPLTDPSIDHLRMDEPIQGRAWRSWWDSNIEIAFWRGDPVFAAFETPEEAPTWAGPIVGGRREPGCRVVHALTQEAYIQRSCIGHELLNYLTSTDGTATGYTFEGDPDLDEWSIDIIGGGSATTSGSGVQYLPGHVAILNDATMSAEGEVPFSTGGNYAHVGVAVYVPSGTTPLFPVDGGGAVVGEVTRLTSDDGVGFWGTVGDEGGDSFRLMLPARYEEDRWYPLSVQMGQTANRFVKYRLSLYGGDGGPIRFSAPKINRPANVGAAPGDDIGDVADAIAEEQVDLLIGPFDRSGEEVGINLVEPARYFTDAHEDAADALSDWYAYLDWWVEECTIRTGQRGVEIVDTLTGPDLSGWVVEDDATDAYSHLYVQVRPEEGPHDQIALVMDSPATRLTHVVEVPAGMAPADAANWGEAVLLDGAPAQSLTGVPVKYTTLPGERLADFMPGNWLQVTITEPGPSGDIVDSFQPVVDRVTWDPISDEVKPTWVLGRKAKRDWTEMMAALLKQRERERRRRRALKPDPDYQKHVQTDEWIGTAASLEQEVGEGVWMAVVRSNIEGGTGGDLFAQLDTGSGSALIDDDYQPIEADAGTTAAKAVGTVRGPATVRAITQLLSLSGSVSIRNLQMSVHRIA